MGIQSCDGLQHGEGIHLVWREAAISRALVRCKGTFKPVNRGGHITSRGKMWTA